MKHVMQLVRSSNPLCTAALLYMMHAHTLEAWPAAESTRAQFDEYVS